MAGYLLSQSNAAVAIDAGRTSAAAPKARLSKKPALSSVVQAAPLMQCSGFACGRQFATVSDDHRRPEVLLRKMILMILLPSRVGQ
jgi:hypothetical protein